MGFVLCLSSILSPDRADALHVGQLCADRRARGAALGATSVIVSFGPVKENYYEERIVFFTSLERLSGGARQRFQRHHDFWSLEKELSRSAQATRKDRAKWRRREAGRRVAVSSRARSPSSSSSSSCHRPDVGWRPEDDDTTLAAFLLPDIRRRTLSASAGKMCCKSKTLRLFGTMHRSPSPPHPSRKEPAKNDHVALKMTRSALTHHNIQVKSAHF